MHTDADLAIRMVNEDVELSTIQGHRLPPLSSRSR